MMRVVTCASLLLFATALGWSIISAREPRIPEGQVTYRPIQIQEGGYVSSDTCKACHPAQYEAWHDSFHRTMTQLPTTGTVRADFDGVRVTDVPGNPIDLEVRDDEFWAEFGDPDWKSSEAGERPRIRRQIVMVTGSHYQQVYWYRTDRTRVVGQLPATYLINERRWIPRDSALLHPPVEKPGSETGRWNAICVNCHATDGKRRFDAPADVETVGASSMTADTQVGEFGIACEACHGPAAEHARQNRNPMRRYWQYLTGKADRSAIVQPAAVESGALVAGLRPVSRRVGVLRSGSGTPGELDRAAVPSRRRAPRNARRRATHEEPGFADRTRHSRRIPRVPERFILVGWHDSSVGA